MFDKQAATEMFRFGRWLFVGTAMSFLSTQTDRLVLGKITTLDTLGIYYIAATLASMPGQALGMLTWNVLFPALSRAFENNDDPTTTFKKARQPILLLGGLATSVLIGAGPFIVDAMYDDRYLQAGWMLRIIACSAWLVLVQQTLQAALVARNASGPSAASNALKLIGMLVAIPYGNTLGGFRGALIGLVLVDVLATGLLTIGVRSIGIRDWSQSLFATALVAATGAVGVVVADFLDKPLSGSIVGDIAGSVAVLVAVAALWAPLLIKQAPALRAALKR